MCPMLSIRIRIECDVRNGFQRGSYLHRVPAWQILDQVIEERGVSNRSVPAFAPGTTTCHRLRVGPAIASAANPPKTCPSGDQVQLEHLLWFQGSRRFL